MGIEAVRLAWKRICVPVLLSVVNAKTLNWRDPGKQYTYPGKKAKNRKENTLDRRHGFAN